MNNEIERPPLSRQFRLDEIRERASGTIDATAAERAAICRLLELKRLDGLTLTYRLLHTGAGRLRLKGQLKADATQTCVVSLDPVPALIDVPVEVEFWPAAMIEAELKREEASGSTTLANWPEPIKDGRIDLGPLIYETLATSLDPYPKREGVSFEWSQGADEPGQEAQKEPVCGPRPPETALRPLARGKIRLSTGPLFSLFGFHFRGLPRRLCRMGIVFLIGIREWVLQSP